MYQSVKFYSLARHFPAYALLRSTREAVLIPLLLAALLLYFGPKRPLPKGHGVVFMLSVMFSVVFSIHVKTPGVEALYALPGYALMILLLPREYQPTWSAAFALSFFSLFLTDLWSSASWSLSKGYLPGNFYYGIGGAGFHDLLFIGPWLAAVPLMLIDFIIERGLAPKSLTECVQGVKNKVLRRRALETSAVTREGRFGP